MKPQNAESSLTQIRDRIHKGGKYVYREDAEALLALVDHLRQEQEDQAECEKAMIGCAHSWKERAEHAEAACASLRTALEAILQGFDRGVFVRSTDGDSDPAWAIKLFPYVKALADAKHALALPDDGAESLTQEEKKD